MPDQRVAAQPILHPAYTVFMEAHHAATRAGPDDPRLGPFRKGSAGTLVLLEVRDRASAQLHRPASPKSYSTPKVMKRLLANPRNRVDQRAVLRARLLDMILALGPPPRRPVALAGLPAAGRRTTGATRGPNTWCYPSNRRILRAGGNCSGRRWTSCLPTRRLPK